MYTPRINTSSNSIVGHYQRIFDYNGKYGKWAKYWHLKDICVQSFRDIQYTCSTIVMSKWNLAPSNTINVRPGYLIKQNIESMKRIILIISPRNYLIKVTSQVLSTAVNQQGDIWEIIEITK